MVAASTTDLLAVDKRISASRANRNAITTVANTSRSVSWWALEGAPEVDVLVAAVPKVEPRVLASQLVHHTQLLAYHRANDDEQQHSEQNVDPEPLMSRFAPTDHRSDV